MSSEQKSKQRSSSSPYGIKLILFISSSIFLNIFFFCYVILSRQQLSWTKTAASEAEMVASIDCSGHGHAFLDGVLVAGMPVCECNSCYAGHDCSQLMPDCPADADSGDPRFLEPYWQLNAASSVVVISGWHRMSYRANGDHFISLELEKHIRTLHKAVGNAVTDGKYIVFGDGSLQLVNALVHALSLENASSIPAEVVAAAPYYNTYKTQTNFFDSPEYKWAGSTSRWLNMSGSAGSSFIELVTSPNNPDGVIRQSVLGGSSVIYDHAYYWPHFTAITSPADKDFMLFTISKASGHAGSRFGWAVIKDEEVYKRVTTYMFQNTMGVSREAQLRVLKLVKVILAESRGENDIFDFGHKTLKLRWNKLNTLVSSSSRFSLLQHSPQFCNYFKKTRDPSPAYAWLKCEMEEEKDCGAVLQKGGISSRPGTAFGVDSSHVRLSLVRSQDDFDMLLHRLKPLVSNKAVASW